MSNDKHRCAKFSRVNVPSQLVTGSRSSLPLFAFVFLFFPVSYLLSAGSLPTTARHTNYFHGSNRLGVFLLSILLLLSFRRFVVFFLPFNLTSMCCMWRCEATPNVDTIEKSNDFCLLSSRCRRRRCRRWMEFVLICKSLKLIVFLLHLAFTGPTPPHPLPTNTI